MSLGKVAAVALLAMIVATPAAAIPDTDWATFLEGSFSPYGDDEDQDWEDLLFEAAEETADAPAAVARFGRVLGAAPAQAEAWADVIVAAVVLRETCDREPCTITPGDAAWDRVMTPALAEPSGELLWVVARNLSGVRSLGDTAVIAAVQGHPRRVQVLTRLYEYNGELAVLAGLLLERPRDPVLLQALLASDSSVSGGPDGWDGWQLAILEVAAERAAAQGAGPDERAIYAQALLTRYLDLGLTEEGLRLYRALPEEVRDRLPLASPPCGADDSGCPGRPAGEALTDELVAALALAGDRAGAMEVSARAAARLGDAAQWDSRQRRLAVLDAFERTAPAAGLFRLMVEGDGLDGDDRRHGMSGEGRMFLPYGPASRRLVADRLAEAGYPSIARALVDRPLYYRAGHGGYEDTLSRTQGFPAEVADRRRELAAAIEAAWAASGPAPVPSRTAPISPPAGWTEARLPDGVPAWTRPAGRETWSEEPPAPPELAGLAVPAGAILRHQSVAGEHYVLFQSSELDLPGEIPAYGVWLARTEAGAWTAPVYLGLQQHFPYVVTPDSALPLVADGRLQIEVQAREIAPASITFPPVGLSLAREEDGLFIARPLAEVFADADADGITDLAEARMGLDPGRADTDGDGRPDGVDSAPLTATTGSASPARRSLALAILQQLTGHDAGAIVVSPREPVEGEDEMAAILDSMGEPPPPPPAPRSVIVVSDDPALFADLDLPFRLMVYTPEQIRRLSESGAPFYPPRVDIHASLDGREHFVIWSASWVGGNFIARCPDDGGPCEVEVRSSWIT